MNTRISVRTATIKWELRKRLEICWRPFLLMTAILAVHACMTIPEAIQPVFLTLPSIIFVMVGWYFFVKIRIKICIVLNTVFYPKKWVKILGRK